MDVVHIRWAPVIQFVSVGYLEGSSVVPGSVQVPENRTRGQKSFRTGPGTARISESVLEPEPEPPKALGQFQNHNYFGMSVLTSRNKGILFGCVSGKNWSLMEAKQFNIESITV